MSNEPFMLKAYDKHGNVKYKQTFASLYDCLHAYVHIRGTKVPTLTIWMFHNGIYVRIHDFSFLTLTPKTYLAYLNERILDTDDLLKHISDNDDSSDNPS